MSGKGARSRKVSGAYYMNHERIFMVKLKDLPTLKERREAWLAALESGDYEQGTGTLKNDTKFCCLGVLCDISGLGEWEHSNYRMDEGGQIGGYPDPNDAVALLVRLERPITLANQNDGGATFREIAQTLRKEWKLG